MRRILAPMLLCVGAVWTASAPASTPVPSDAPFPVATTAAPGEIEFRLDPDQLARLGLVPVPRLDSPRLWRITLPKDAQLVVALEDGAPTRVLSGRIELTGFALKHARRGLTPPLHLAPGPSERLELSLRDAEGGEWLRIAHGMRSPEPQDGLRLFTAELRIGAALARWLGRAVEGELFGGAALRVALLAPPRHGEAPAKSCAVPNWPGTPGYVADVHLTHIDSVQVQPGRCRNLATPGQPCDGPGGGEGEMVIVPSATLRNSTAANAAEIPWYTKFTGPSPPYGNDQHPFLVWNLYRLDAEGRLLQIGRSGLKHAFATANTECSEPCPNAHILGRGCSDLYDASSNDCSSLLAPRRDVIPARGQWGRCGSQHDPDCDGVQGLPPYSGGVGFCTAPNSSPAGDGYSFRLRAKESQIDPGVHPAARWFVDAWYVVRDDVDLFNTMGSREVFPDWSGASWSVGVPGPYVVGALIDRWLALATPGERVARVLAQTMDGQVLVGLRARELPDQRWRYDYAIMNLDYSRAAVTGTEPNLRIHGNLGFDAIELELRNGAVADAADLRDGDGDSGNDWTFAPAAGLLRWDVAAAATLDWGQLVSLQVISAASPGMGELRLGIADPGAEPALILRLPVPDPAAVFMNGFE